MLKRSLDVASQETGCDSAQCTQDWLVGIDLGTSHTAVARSKLGMVADPDAPIDLFELQQLTRPGEVEALPLLPSVSYLSSAEEIALADCRLPWSKTEDSSEQGVRPILGTFARLLGAKSPGRLVTSAKSWLSLSGVDRMRPILPWHGLEGIPRISPLEASASYLRHICEAWNHANPDARLEFQDIVLTVPASFDEAARSLTIEAAALAGLGEVHLLEEPQAVCYDWLWRMRNEKEARILEGVRLVLVLDLGGGTLDLSLIAVDAQQDGGSPKLTRIAVGQHLMLGGDNLDHAVARMAVEKLRSQGHQIMPEEFPQWVEASRKAKEVFLGDEAPDHYRVTLLGSGGRLLGGARTVELERAEVVQQLLDGFFPLVQRDEFPQRRQSAVLDAGLPYAYDPGITRHVAAFLEDHRMAVCEALGGDLGSQTLPNALLLNGGTFKSQKLVQRILDQFYQWGARDLRLLANPRPETSVAYGAVAYAKARRGLSIRKIEGGAGRTVFLLMADRHGDLNQACCVLPRGSAEDEPVILEQQIFLLRVGVPVEFILAEALDGIRPAPGTVMPLSDFPHRILPPLHLTLGDQGDVSSERQVYLLASLSSIGTLELSCVDLEDPEKRWAIEFELRSRREIASKSETPGHPRLHEAAEIIRKVFGAKSKEADPKAPRRLRAELEKVLGPREEWDLALLRMLFGVLMEGSGNRRRSADHERQWLNLAGFCLRPGFGDTGDIDRIDRLFEVLGKSPQFVNEPKVWSEWWTFWRRISGGLDAARQYRIFEDIRPFLDPARLRIGNQSALAKKRSPEDLIRLAAVLERLPSEMKLELGRWLLLMIEKSPDSREIWWALGRLGSRVPLYGNLDQIIPARDIEPWVDRLLQCAFRENTDAAFAVAMMARVSGQVEYDLSSEIRNSVADALEASRMPNSWQQMVRALSQLTDADERRISGETLPPGLRLAHSEN